MGDEEISLGDGLYASFDGWHIVLRLPGKRRDRYVLLEPVVFAALADFASKVWPRP